MKTYYTDSSSHTCLVNTMMCMDGAIVKHFSDMLFKGDTSRVVYASTERCFRERAKDNEGVLNLPFMNIYRRSIGPQVSYNSWRNKDMTINGIFIDELGATVRALPVTVTYDANVFYGGRMPDSLIASGLTLQDDAYETRLKYFIPIKESDKSLGDIAVLKYNQAFDNLYSDTDYFEKNKIRNIQLDFTFDTFLLLDADVSIGVTEETILNLSSAYSLPDGLSMEEAYSIILDDGTYVVTQTK